MEELDLCFKINRNIFLFKENQKTWVQSTLVILALYHFIQSYDLDKIMRVYKILFIFIFTPSSINIVFYLLAVQNIWMVITSKLHCSIEYIINNIQR